MHEYEIRVIDPDGAISLSVIEIHLHLDTAVASGRRQARHFAFQIWRDDMCVFSQTAAPFRRIKCPPRKHKRMKRPQPELPGLGARA